MSKEKIVKMLINSLLLSYILCFVCLGAQVLAGRKVDISLIALILVSQTSITAPILGFYFANPDIRHKQVLDDDTINRIVIKYQDEEEKKNFDKLL